VVGLERCEQKALRIRHQGPLARIGCPARNPWQAARPQPLPSAGNRVVSRTPTVPEENMAGDWIPVRTNLRNDPAVIALAERLGMDEDHVVGKLVKLWSWANEQTEDGNALGVTEKWLERYIGVTGFAEALSEVGWLSMTNGSIVIPKFDRYNAQSSKRRLLTAKRVAEHRAQKCNASSVTKTLPEKRREEKSTQKKTTSSSARTQTDVWGSGPIQLDTKSRKWLGVTEKDLAGWTEAYPACDVAGELKRALEWCLSNGARGRKKAYRAFLTRWLSKSQDRGGSQPRNPYGPQTGHNPILDRGGD